MKTEGGGGKQSKAGHQQKHHHQGWLGGAEQLLGSFGSRLTLVIGVGCICSFVYVALLLVSTNPCWTCATSTARPYYRDGTPVCSLKSSSSNSNAGRLLQFINGTEVSRIRVHQGTSLDRIVFGIGASAHFWPNRSQFINTWWQKGKTRGYVWFDRDLGDKWSPGDPDYKVSEGTSQFQYTHKTGSRAAIRISRLVSESFRLGLPDVDWFVMGDDDTFFFTENLVSTLSKYDHMKLWYIGSNSEDHIQNQLFSYNMAYGGGGFAISYPLAALLAEKQDACIHRYPFLYGSDDRMKACMSELGVPLTKEPGFHQFDVRGDVQGLLASHPVAPIISLHHLEAIYSLFPNLTRAESLALLMEAVNIAPYNVFQQSICYDEEQKWSFSVSWGYVIHVYKGFVAPNILEVPILTFLSWHKRRESYAFPLNTRPRAREICEEPSTYYLEHVNGTTEEGLTRTTYHTGDRLNRVRVCQEKLLPMSLVQDILVDSEILGAEWVGNPLRQCCKVREVKENSVSIHVGACRAGASLVPDAVTG